MFFTFPRNTGLATVTWMTPDVTHVAHIFLTSCLDHSSEAQMDMPPSMLSNCQLVKITTTHLLCRICYYELIKLLLSVTDFPEIANQVQGFVLSLQV